MKLGLEGRNVSKRVSSLGFVIQSSLDCHGMTVDEAISYIDAKLDSLYIVNVRCVEIITGVGTGALLKALPTYFEKSPYVEFYSTSHVERELQGCFIIKLM